VVDRLSIRSFTLWGSGFFGIVAIEYALAHPEKVDALLLSGIRRGPADQLTTNLEDLAARDWDTFARYMTNWFAGYMETPVLPEVFYQAVDQVDWLHRVETVKRTEFEDLLPQIEVPTLVLAPTGLPASWVEDARGLAAEIPDSQLMIVSGEDLRTHQEEIAAKVLAFVSSETAAASSLADVPAPSLLSNRELEVLGLLAAGHRNQQIADELVISLNTVRRHVSNIFAKTGAANRVEATVYARNHGLL
jgi:DNA-binding CsgD family transcriptional regulator